MVKRETSACKRVVAASEGGSCWRFDSTPRGKTDQLYNWTINN